MNKCIVCECENIIVYEAKGTPPLTCNKCGRVIGLNWRRYKEDDPYIVQIREKSKIIETEEKKIDENVLEISSLIETQNDISDNKVQKKHKFVLRSEDGRIIIQIPEDGGIIGRTAIGKFELAHNGMISREHIKLTPTKRTLGFMVEDLSSNGSFVNGKELKNVEFVSNGSVIRLYNENYILEVVDEE